MLCIKIDNHNQLKMLIKRDLKEFLGKEMEYIFKYFCQIYV